VSSTVDTSANQARSARATSSIFFAWLLPIGVVMNAAQPPFSLPGSARYAQAAGLARDHSENTTPNGTVPTSL
jgi:hypothetical protein